MIKPRWLRRCSHSERKRFTIKSSAAWTCSISKEAISKFKSVDILCALYWDL